MLNLKSDDGLHPACITISQPWKHRTLLFQFGDPSLELVAHLSAERDESWSCIDKLPTFRLGKERTLRSGLAVAVDAEQSKFAFGEALSLEPSLASTASIARLGELRDNAL